MPVVSAMAEAAGTPSHARPAIQVRKNGGTVSQPIALTLIT